MAKPIVTPEDRFMSRVEPEPNTGCWLWTGALGHFGHGRFAIRLSSGRHHNARAHRVAWEMNYGPIPERMCVLHRCDNPPCVNPDHLFLGDHNANNKDMAAKSRGRSSLSGLPYGVRKSGARFAAFFYYDGATEYLGTFSTIEEANRKAMNAKSLHYGGSQA